MRDSASVSANSPTMRDALEPSVPQIVILGNDAVLAAAPATPVQLAHACRTLGYELAIPASWGDELVAEGCLDRLGTRDRAPVILASCPHTAERLTRAGGDLGPMMVHLVSPPVAAARYVRAAYTPRTVHITYVGSCPGAQDAAIDVQLAPAQLLAIIADRGVVLAEQPDVFESVLPPDRRRFYSLPGGAPAAEHLAVMSGRVLAELSGDDVVVELSQRLVSRENALVDPAPRLGCACSGATVATVATPPFVLRQQVSALEPARARAAVLDPSVRIELDLPVPRESPRLSEGIPVIPPRSTREVIVMREPREPTRVPSAEPLAPERAAPARTEPPAALQAAALRDWYVARRRRPRAAPGAPRPQSVIAPGRAVPRAYLGARRRTKARNADNTAPSAVESERRIETRAEGAESRKSKRTPRSSTATSEPPRPVPPPPGRTKRGTLLGVGIAIGLTLSGVALPTANLLAR